MKYYKVNQSDMVSEIKKNIECGCHTGFHVMVETPIIFGNKEADAYCL